MFAEAAAADKLLGYKQTHGALIYCLLGLWGI